MLSIRLSMAALGDVQLPVG